MIPLPEVLADTAEGCLFRVDGDHPAFQGHFPGDPVLPGVVQVDWALRMAEARLGPLGPFLGLDRVKFLAPIRPGDTVELRLALKGGVLAFRYAGCGGVLSSGSARFGGAP